MRRPSVVLLIAGVILGYVGYKEMRFARLASGEARSLTCAQLASQSPGSDCGSVRLTDYWFGRAYIYRTGPDNSKWTVAYVPAFPGRPGRGALGAAQFNDEVKVIIKATSVRSRRDLYALEGQPLSGVVVNELESFSDDEKAVLRGTYPKIDFDRCWIIEVNRQPATPGRILSLVGGGGALAVLGVAMFFMGNRAGTNLLPRNAGRYP